MMVQAILKIIRNPMKKETLTLCAAAIVSLTLAGCGTQIKSLPLQSAVPAATTTTGADVALYFGAQPHPQVVRKVGDASHSVRVASAAAGPDASCNKALADALDKLRGDARDKGANAVINVKTRFHETVSDSATEYTCGVSPSAAAIAVTGDLVVLQAN
jgi:uncharacterized protein YbjQ (UPF0145 family)